MRFCHFQANGEMILEIRLLVGLFAVLSGSSQTRGQTSPPVSPTPTRAALQSHGGASAAPGSNGSWPEVSQMHNPAARNETSGGSASESDTSAAFSLTATSAAATPALTDAAGRSSLPATPTTSAPAGTLSSTLTLEPSTPPQMTPDPFATFSSPPVHVEQDVYVTTSTLLSQHEFPTPVSTPLVTIESPLTSAAGQSPTVPTHREVPAQLNVGDEDIKQRHRSSSLDPLLAGLLSVFIVTTAIVFITLFFRFRQRTNHPEFHRLQDLPMDDLMEDTPLSRYTY